MRRTDREIIDTQIIHEILERSMIMSLAFKGEEYPYCVLLNFIEQDGDLYFHCAREGYKLDCMKRDPHVHFTDFDEAEVDAEKATIYYRSVSGTGIAEIVEDDDLKIKVLEALMRKYCSKETIPPFKKPEKTLVVKVSVTSLTGKQHAKAGA